MPPSAPHVSGITPVVYSCCSVAVYGMVDDPCWMCGALTGRDAWTETDHSDYDGRITRQHVTIKSAR